MAFDFVTVSSPFRMQPGLRRLAAGATQLTPNHLGDRALQEKLTVLSGHAAQALLVAPGFDPQPALQALARHACTEHPGALRCSASGWHAPLLGWGLQGELVEGSGPSEIGACLRALPVGWRQAALLALAFAEDFAVIDGATARIPWLAVCLPSHWAPEEKIGLHFSQVHEPVADNRTLITASEHLARLVTGMDHWERFVWTIGRGAHLDRHPKRHETLPWPADANADALAGLASFRTERQTFITLPEHRQAVFTIHVESRPLTQALTSPEHARQLHDALASMSAAVLSYRGLTDARDRLLAWLSRQADAPSA